MAGPGVIRTDLRLTIPGNVNPLLVAPSLRNQNGVFRELLAKLRGALFGQPGLSHIDRLGSRQSFSVLAGLTPAQAQVTCAAVTNADTMTLNGQALTAAQHRASCTVTFASVADADTITVNGLVFTAKTSPSGNYQFARGVTDTADAAAFVAKLNAATTRGDTAVHDSGVYGKIEATSSAGVVTLYAITEGTAGNSYTIVTSNGTRLAITNDNSGLFANGAAAVNNEFDYIGSNARTARSVVDNLALSSTAALSKHVAAACRSAIVTCSSVAVGDSVTLGQVKLTANNKTTDNGGARVLTNKPDEWCQGSTDTNDGASLANCINNHPLLMDRFYAVNSSGAVSIFERPPEATEAPKISTSNGTRLAITSSLTALADSAVITFQSLARGYAGNAITIATGNGTRMAITGGLSRLAGGTATSFSV